MKTNLKSGLERYNLDIGWRCLLSITSLMVAVSLEAWDWSKNKKNRWRGDRDRARSDDSNNSEPLKLRLWLASIGSQQAMVVRVQVVGDLWLPRNAVEILVTRGRGKRGNTMVGRCWSQMSMSKKERNPEERDWADCRNQENCWRNETNGFISSDVENKQT